MNVIKAISCTILTIGAIVIVPLAPFLLPQWAVATLVGICVVALLFLIFVLWYDHFDSKKKEDQL